jgi:predicted AlkP superfamily phosphohydrolase/phosphomutase
MDFITKGQSLYDTPTMRTSPTTGLKTLLVGIDAGCFNVLDPLVESGEVPCLASLIQDGVSDVLESQVPPWTASAWPSLYTGVNPGKHGVYGFLSFDGYDWDIVNASHIQELTLWELLDRNDISSVVVNAPLTYPPPSIDGAVVPGYVAPEHPQCHPEGLFEELTDEIGEYRVYTPSLKKSVPEQQKIREYRDLIGMRGDAFRYLTDRFDPEFGFLQFQVTDTVCHEFPGDRDKLRSVYSEVDRELQSVIDECQPDTVIVVSDHGIGAFEERFSINSYLREHDYVAGRQGGLGMPTWAAVRDTQLTKGEEADGPSQTAADKLMEKLAAVGITSQRVGSALETVGLDQLVMDIVPDSLIRAGSEQVDFPASTAYMRSRVECGIRLNVRGREPDGVVDPADYETVRSELISLLSAVETPAGDRVFERVAPREEFFSGPYVEDAVDIVTIPNEYDYYFTTWLTGELFETPTGPAWDHTPSGFIAASGAGIDTAVPAGEPHLFDVAPTVLATLGVPISDRMDGSPLPFVDHPGGTTYDGETTERTDLEDEAVSDRLADLGYLE